MSRSAAICEQLISSFRAELAEHVQTMTDGLLALEQARVPEEQRPATLEDVFRAAHSLKGAARAVNLTVIEQLAHSLEGILDGLQRQAMPPSAELFTVCYRALDAIQAVQASYEAGETTPPLAAVIALADLEALRNRPPVPAAPSPPPPAPAVPAAAPPAGTTSPAGEETIRIGVAKLDALMAQLSELLVARIRAEQRLGQIRQVQALVAQWQRETAAGQVAVPRLSAQTKDGSNREVARLLAAWYAAQERLREVEALLSDLARQQVADMAHMAQVVDAFDAEIKRIRMLPLSTITAPFGRMVRDLARDAGKEAVLEIEGADTELDKRVLEQIKDPLIHLLRNAIDHGIEPPEQRVAAGKPRAGTIGLAAGQVGQDVVISVADDGAGLDTDAIRRVLARRGRADASSLTDADLEGLILAGGLTTSPIITDISGRGVGLSVVRRNIEALRGRVTVDWSRGAGTAFTLTLPLTLTSMRGLIVGVAGRRFVVPLSAVERILALAPDDIIMIEGHAAIHFGGQPVALVRLDDVLGLRPAHSGSAHQDLSVVILSSVDQSMAFIVDELPGEQDVVVKSLGQQLQRVAGIGGATVLGSGEVALILNANDLIKLGARGRGGAILDVAAEAGQAAEPSRRPIILIVDDSITTRTLEKNILEAVGYDVRLAADGLEALNAIVGGGLPDLVVSDVLMPRLDGFELTRRLRADQRTADVPVILVTSLESVEDKTRGIEVGADAYIVKSGFDQQNLLDTIQQLI